GLLHQVTEQEPDLVTAKLRDELSQSGIMALGHRVSPFESTADELAEDSTVAPSDHGSTYTTRWDAYCLPATRRTEPPRPRPPLRSAAARTERRWIPPRRRTPGA